jgi:hypothetical protein
VLKFKRKFRRLKVKAVGEHTNVANNSGEGGINLKYTMKSFQSYSITVDESTDVKDPAQLAVFIHSCN